MKEKTKKNIVPPVLREEIKSGFSGKKETSVTRKEFHEQKKNFVVKIEQLKSIERHKSKP